LEESEDDDDSGVMKSKHSQKVDVFEINNYLFSKHFSSLLQQDQSSDDEEEEDYSHPIKSQTFKNSQEMASLPYAKFEEEVMLIEINFDLKMYHNIFFQPLQFKFNREKMSFPNLPNKLAESNARMTAYLEKCYKMNSKLH